MWMMHSTVRLHGPTERLPTAEGRPYPTSCLLNHSGEESGYTTGG